MTEITVASRDNTVVGMIGIGDMGAALAVSLMRTYSLVVFDLRAEAVQRMVTLGARAADSREALSDQCEVVIVVVVNDKQVNQVVGDLLRRPGKIHTIIVSSTVLPTTVIALGEQARALGVDLIDAPVSGGAEKASRGIITVLIGGDEGPVRRCWPIFQAFGKGLFHIGPLGAGSAGKLVNNLLSLGGNMLIQEGMQLARAYGISEEAVTEFVAVGTGDSRSIHTWGLRDRARRTHHLGGTDAIYEIFSKDVKSAALAAGLRGVTLPIAATIGATMVEQAKARDKYLLENGLTGAIPQCSICGQELASPYRKAGVHPECAFDTPGESLR
jgi:3-hydroxyisobutyrate dehydrogenase-like beta-hydroxyacid dehydrogenase